MCIKVLARKTGSIRSFAISAIAIAAQIGGSACYGQLANNSAQTTEKASPSGQADHDHSGHDHSTKQETYLDYDAETDKLKQALQAMRDQVKLMMAAQIRYHDSDAKDQEKRYRREFFEALEPMPKLQLKVLEAGLEEFKSDPNSKVKLGHLLFKTLKRNTDKDNFEGMLPIAKTLFEMGFPAPELPQIYMQACLAESDFSQAKTVIQLNEKYIANPAVMIEKLNILEQEWQEELEARKRDAAGEPLPRAKIHTTKGTVIVELFENDAPEAVASFISLAEAGYYDGLDFFFVGDHQVAQTGSPNEDGTGSPGYMILDENKKPGARKLFRGSLALALLPGRPDSGGSVFFIPFMPALELDKNNYTVFGRVVSEMTPIANLNRVKPSGKGESEEEKKNKPKVDPDEIMNIEIMNKRDHKYEPKKLPIR